MIELLNSINNFNDKVDQMIKVAKYYSIILIRDFLLKPPISYIIIPSLIVFIISIIIRLINRK